MVQKEEISWDKIVTAFKEAKLPVFKKVVTITRGGLFVAGIYSEIYGVKHIDTVCLESYDDDKQRQMKIIKCTGSDESDIVIIDDVADTGESLLVAKKYYPNAKTLTIHYKPHSKFKPDYYLWETENWIVYPWERF